MSAPPTCLHKREGAHTTEVITVEDWGGDLEVGIRMALIDFPNILHILVVRSLLELAGGLFYYTSGILTLCLLCKHVCLNKGAYIQ